MTFILISIHALVKRATADQINPNLVISNFNPRPREEGDNDNVRYVNISKHFNPRPREEGDDDVTSSALAVTYFNPRPREEGDFL